MRRPAQTEKQIVFVSRKEGDRHNIKAWAGHEYKSITKCKPASPLTQHFKIVAVAISWRIFDWVGSSLIMIKIFAQHRLDVA